MKKIRVLLSGVVSGMTRLIVYIFLLASVNGNAQSYCTTGLADPTYGCAWGSAINDFSLSNVNQSGTGCSGEWADYTSQTIQLASGESFLFTLTSTSNSWNYTYDFAAIWIDFNDNFSFADPGEMVFSSPAGGVFSGTITIPVSAPLGNHRLRVRLKTDYSSLTPFAAGDACTFFYYGETHDYTAQIASAPTCQGLSSLSVSKIKKFSAQVNWGCGGCSGPFIIEYGLSGFTPGTGNNAGPGGTKQTANSSPSTISGLLADKDYDVYVRRKCGTTDYSLNFGPVKFHTVYDACATMQTIACGQTAISSLPAGRGEFDFYPGQPVPAEGKENIFRFTPDQTGKFVMNITNSNSNQVYCFIKEASLGCDRYSWNYVSTLYSAPAMVLLGTLTAGVDYYILFDNPNPTWATEHEFNIGCYSPYDPCPDITTTLCESPVNITIEPGAGKFDIPAALSEWETITFLGKEKILSYTPSTNGKIRLKVTAPDFQNGAGFYIKPVSGGCNAEGWTFIGHNYSFGPYYTWYSESCTVTAGTPYYILSDANDLGGRNLTIEISCPDVWEPCDAIVAVTCGTPVIGNIPAGLGKFDTTGYRCNYRYMPGKELIFSFTPTQTGYYTIDVSATEYNKMVNYMIREADNCDAEDWICLGGVGAYSLTGSFLTPLQLQAGETYYLLMDAEETSAPSTQTFTIQCTIAEDPCAGITPLTCGLIQHVSIPLGISFFSPYLNYSILNGKEKIMSFTPPATGTYFLRVTNRTGTSPSYAIKPAADGCNPDNWILIQQFYSNNTSLIPISLVAGTEYYILADYYYYADYQPAVDEDIEILCPSETYDPCATLYDISGCASPVTSVHAPGVGAFVTYSNFFTYGTGIAGPAGKENIYRFTATQTGRYIIRATGGTGEVSFAIKEMSGGCNGSGWTNIGNAGGNWYYYPSDLPIPLQLTAGSSYFILVDANDIIGASITFELICPENYDGCNEIIPITCGPDYIPVNLTAGFGNLFLPPCYYPYQAVGKEVIFEFTASGNGSQPVEVSTSMTFLGYIKKSSLGCGPAGWTCIGQAYSPTTWYTPDLIAGEPYLLMFVPVSNYGVNTSLMSFRLLCPSGCRIYADADGDGYGDPARVFQECWNVPFGYSANNLDCNDAVETINPGAPEICGNLVDDDCDGEVDEEDCTCGNITVSITPGDAANSFCNGLQLTAVTEATVQSYNWSTGETTESIMLTTEDPEGDYTVTIQNELGCQATASFHYNPQDYASSYTILALKSIKFQGNNTVLHGSAGVTGAGGKASLKRNASIAGTGAFLKAANISLQSPYNIPNIIYAPVVVTLPVMQYNMTSTNGLPNAAVPNGATVTINGNRKNVTIGNNCNVTMTGSIFGNVSIGSGSVVLFAQSTINITGITLSGGTVSASTRIRFNSDAVIKCSGNISTGIRCEINPDNHKLILYMGKPGNAPVHFTVAPGGLTTVNASIYLPSGKISVGGDGSNTTWMNGKFIAEHIETLDKYVTWNWYDCDEQAPPVNSKDLHSRPTGNDATTNDILSVKAWPNPSTDEFNLLVRDQTDELIRVNIYDMQGRLINTFSVKPNAILRFGNNLRGGMYIAEIRRGSSVSRIKLIKQ